MYQGLYCSLGVPRTQDCWGLQTQVRVASALLLPMPCVINLVRQRKETSTEN